MNKEEAIKGLKEDIYNLKNFLTDTEKEKWQEAIDTVLNYIEELENRLKEKENIVKKSSLEAQKYFDMLMEVEYGRDTIPKQKVRDKIEELNKKRKYCSSDEMREYHHQIEILKELLGEGD